MKTLNPHRRLFRAVAPLLLTMPLAHAVPLDVPAVADINVSENDGLDGASLANAPDMNARFNNSTRNEILVLRFNLAGYDSEAI